MLKHMRLWYQSLRRRLFADWRPCRLVLKLSWQINDYLALVCVNVLNWNSLRVICWKFHHYPLFWMLWLLSTASIYLSGLSVQVPISRGLLLMQHAWRRCVLSRKLFLDYFKIRVLECYRVCARYQRLLLVMFLYLLADQFFSRSYSL
jgi:hypothetical protein